MVNPLLVKGEDITSKSIEYRAKMGIGLAYQNPPVIKGLPLKKLVGLIQKENFKLEAYIDNLNTRGWNSLGYNLLNVNYIVQVLT